MTVIFTLVLGSMISTHWVDMLSVVTAAQSAPANQIKSFRIIFSYFHDNYHNYLTNPPDGGAGLLGQGMVTELIEHLYNNQSENVSLHTCI